MSIPGNNYNNKSTGPAMGAVGTDTKTPARYKVILEGVRSEIETVESFAIKFSILTRTPVSKINFLVKKMPAVVWEGMDKIKALGLLSMIDEAGGLGRLDTVEKTEKSKIGPEPKKKTPKERECGKCGFPVKKEDKFCQFCSTPLTEVSKEIISVKIKSYNPAIPPKRLIFYLALLLVAFALGVILR